MGLCTSRYESNESLPPQQNPAAPIAETPFSFNAATIGFASSNPLSYMQLYVLKRLVIAQDTCGESQE